MQVTEEKMTGEMEKKTKTSDGGYLLDKLDNVQMFPALDLGEALKEGTKEDHTKAQNVRFVQEFLRGNIRMDIFKVATAGLYFLYTALEDIIEKNKEHPSIAPLYFPLELNRKEPLEGDLEYLYGKNWREEIICIKSVQNYVDHLNQTPPELIPAHAYTRIMGDLSGGQVAKKVAQRSLKLPASGEGIFFYTFKEIDNLKTFKMLYRNRLDCLEVDQEAADALVEESKTAFKLNMQVFEELDRIAAATPAPEGSTVDPTEIPIDEIRKCPYFAKALDNGSLTQEQILSMAQGQGGKSAGATGCPYHMVLGVWTKYRTWILAILVIGIAILISMLTINRM